jgi:hypothetical protein
MVHQKPWTVDAEHDVEAWNLFFDERPLVDAPRALEEQGLRVDRDALRAILRFDARLEIERAAGPREQRVDRVFGIKRAIDDRGVADAAAVEVDRAEAVME